MIPLTPSLEDLQDLGVTLLEQQVDFLYHPEGRLAVAVYGVPDPDRLYIADPSTLYQLAPEGQPANERGYAACLLPIVFQGGEQDVLAAQIADWEGEEPSQDIPSVHGYPCDADFMYSWSCDDVPITVACWDLWPIEADEVHIWASAAENAYHSSRILPMFELIEIYNGSDYCGPETEDLTYQMSAISDEIRLIRNEDGVDDRLLELSDQLDLLRQEIETRSEAYLHRLESAIIHPVTGDIDAQMPPVDLPPEQAAIWRSLQALSWRNWKMLEKHLDDGDSRYGGSFVRSNRRLCPWY